jgi:hypothetical protein
VELVGQLHDGLVQHLTRNLRIEDHVSIAGEAAHQISHAGIESASLEELRKKRGVDPRHLRRLRGASEVMNGRIRLGIAHRSTSPNIQHVLPMP